MLPFEFKSSLYLWQPNEKIFSDEPKEIQHLKVRIYAISKENTELQEALDDLLEAYRHSFNENKQLEMARIEIKYLKLELAMLRGWS